MGLITAARTWAWVVLLTAVLVAPELAPAQPPLTDEIVTASNPSPTQVAQINEFVTLRIAEFESADPEVSRRARVALQRPLSNVAVTPAFRNAYGDALAPRLERIAGNPERQDLAVVAVQVLGDLATERSITVLERTIRDERSVMRYAASQGFARTLRATQTTALAIGPDRVTWIVDRLRDALAREQDPVVAYMHVRALMTASAKDQPTALAAVRTRALMSLASICGERVRKLGNTESDRAMIPALIGAAEFLRDVLAEDTFARSLPRDFVLECAGLGGDMLAYVNRQILLRGAGAFALPEASDGEAVRALKQRMRQLAVSLTTLGEVVVFFGKDALEAGQPVPAPNLARHLEVGARQGDDAFIREVRAVFDMLTRPPFNFPGDRFLN